MKPSPIKENGLILSELRINSVLCFLPSDNVSLQLIRWKAVWFDNLLHMEPVGTQWPSPSHIRSWRLYWTWCPFVKGNHFCIHGVQLWFLFSCPVLQRKMLEALVPEGSFFILWLSESPLLSSWSKTSNPQQSQGCCSVAEDAILEEFPYRGSMENPKKAVS